MSDFLLEKVVCLNCSATLAFENDMFVCGQCGKEYPKTDGIFDFQEESNLSGTQNKTFSTSDSHQQKYWEGDTGYISHRQKVPEFFSMQRWDYLASKIPLEEIETAVDIGCGNGMSTLGLEKYSVKIVACDNSRKMIGSHPGKYRFLVNAYGLPFQNESFDLAFCWELIHHLDRPSDAIREMARVSRKWVIIIDPNPLNPLQTIFSIIDREHRNVFRNSTKFLSSEIKKAGLEIYLHSIVGCIFPNKTPDWALNTMKHIPFEIPALGISHLFIARKK